MIPFTGQNSHDIRLSVELFYVFPPLIYHLHNHTPSPSWTDAVPCITSSYIILPAHFPFSSSTRPSHRCFFSCMIFHHTLIFGPHSAKRASPPVAAASAPPRSLKFAPSPPLCRPRLEDGFCMHHRMPPPSLVVLGTFIARKLHPLFCCIHIYP